jgi:hypothetical protein
MLRRLVVRRGIRNRREKKVANWARRNERERILEILKDRHLDLISCTKNDGCYDLAKIVAVCIEDINYEDERQK